MPIVSSVMGSSAGPAIASAQAGQTTTQRGNYELTGAEAEDDALLIRLVKLPAQHRIVSLVVENDDLDSGSGLVVDVGIEDTVQDPDDSTDANLVATGVTYQAAAVVRYETQAMLEFGVRNYDRFITIDITTAAGTGVPGGIAATLVSRPELGSQFEN